MNMKKEKVLVAMSGGLDSSIACVLLQEQGYEVYGVTLKIWDQDDKPLGCKEISIGGEQDIKDACEVAERLGIQHFVVDVRTSFENSVIRNFMDEYMEGRTPNPCTLCNKMIKWDAVLQKADELQCKYIATGHFSQIEVENNRFFVRKGLDPLKEQSYMLWQLSQHDLSRTLFPLGKLTKTRVREIAIEHGLDFVASKGESFDICFVTDKDYRMYLRRKIPTQVEKFRQGNFVDKTGKFLGHHDGYMFFTIGQRKGLPAMGFRAYVNEIRPSTNEVVIGEEEELLMSKLQFHSMNLMKVEALDETKPITVKLRYHHAGELAYIHTYENGASGEIKFNNPVQAITPGQSAVFYLDDDLLGGAIIGKVLE